MASYTPMINQYQEIKQQHPDEILFFRLGDFYEMFFSDAELASKELEITLTGREGGGNQRIPMCGVPYHSADNYIARLISKGYKVAICEQVEDPKQAKGIVRREVVKIVTPGTILSENLLPDGANNYLATIYDDCEQIIVVAVDISTGECLWADYSGVNRLQAVYDHLYRLMPAEVVLTGDTDDVLSVQRFIDNRIPHCVKTRINDIDHLAITKLLAQHFSDNDLPEKKGAIIAVGYLLHYLHQTLKSDLTHVNRLLKYDINKSMIIDSTTLRNLEITRNLRDGGRRDTLLSVLDVTKTAMGGRLLKKWLESPLLNASSIIKRQDAIEELLANPMLRQTLQDQLSSIYDFERILTRIEVGTANGRDLVALQSSIEALCGIKSSLSSFRSELLSRIGSNISTHTDVAELIKTAIVESPPLSVREGGIIKAGYNKELDELRSIATDSKKWISDLEIREREQTGVKSLKVGYNKVFGYFIEVTHANTTAVPPTYVRKQTLANAERYITPDLKEFENKVLGAQEKIVAIEYQLFITVRDYIKQYIRQIQETAQHIAQVDCLVSLSEVASRYNYKRPMINNARDIVIKDGRHPVVERLLIQQMFVPNDTELNHHSSEIMMITGPNMAGKSTYMRQVALLVIMMQIGSFIPAREASITPVDRVFTRVGASDDLATGQSTFMVEMNEVAHILKNATANSLIILDEIGRGTSTFDGMSIARAVIEYIKERIKAKTLFATHYHELTELADQFPGIKNYTVAVKERGNDVVFLRRIIVGGADKSYGIHVAQLAGLPRKVIERARGILVDLEQSQLPGKTASNEAAASKTQDITLSLFSTSVIDELLSVDIMSTTPLEALNILLKLQTKAKEGAGL